jgi:hypothetical protein
VGAAKNFAIGETASLAAKGFKKLRKAADLAEYADEAAEASSRSVGRHADEVAESVQRQADEVVETAGKQVSLGGKTYDISDFESRKIFKGQEIDPGVPQVVNRDRLHPKILKRLDEGATNLDLMRAGKAPIGPDGLQINLHHVIGKEPGPMIELLATTHQRGHGPLHAIIERGRSFRQDKRLAGAYDRFRGRYWKNRAKDFE